MAPFRERQAPCSSSGVPPRAGPPWLLAQVQELDPPSQTRLSFSGACSVPVFQRQSVWRVRSKLELDRGSIISYLRFYCQRNLTVLHFCNVPIAFQITAFLSKPKLELDGGSISYLR